MMAEQPTVEFFTLIPGGRPPKRADRSGAGYLPSRAMRYCDAVTSGTGYGYWLFPPIDLRLLWTGEQILWSYGDDEAWLPLSATNSGAVQFPNFSEFFDQHAPAELIGYAPPFITALPETGSVQIWTGLVARTRQGWSLNVRAPVNIAPIPGVVTWEGIIETDLWTGPLFTNFRITKTDTPVLFRADTPFLQVQPLLQAAYREDAQNRMAVHDISQMDAPAWRKLGNVLLPPADPTTRQGDYAVAVRKRRSCPVVHDATDLA